MDIINQFSTAMQSAGLRDHNGIVADGKIHRCKVAGDRGSKKNGWYVFHEDGVPAGAFGNWKTGEKQSWCSKSLNELTSEEQEAQRLRMAQINEQRKKEIAAMHEAARQRADKLWTRAETVDDKHPYVVAKQVKPVGIKQLRNMLVVPLYDDKGKLHSLQFIMPNGSKLFLAGGQKKGCFAMLGESYQTICICEGWATGSSIFEATGYSVAVAFDAGNLLPVAKALRKKYPESKIVVCADDDYKTDNNPGINAARVAAQAVAGMLAIPSFGEKRPEGTTDFNDLHHHFGLDSVQCIINNAIKQEKSEHKEDQSITTGKNNLEDCLQQAKQWPPLLLPGTIKLPKIEADILPGWAGNMVKALADYLQVSESAVVLPALSMIATTVQRRYEVAPHGNDSYIEPLCLWSLTILKSGSRKTPILNALSEPLKKWEKQTGKCMDTLIAKNEATRRVAKKRIEKLETKAGNTDDPDKRSELRNEICRELEAIPKEMKLPRLITGDVTPEQLQTMLVEQHERMALISDEAGILQILGGQYSGGAAILDVFLQSFSGSAVRIDRRARQAHLEKPALTFCLMLQPGILQDTANDKRFHDSGLLARFLYAIPEDNIGRRNVRKQNPVSDAIRQDWHEGLNDLLTDC